MAKSSATTEDYTPFEQNDKGHWALHYAVMKGDPDRLYRYVRDRGHPVNAQDFQQNTALHWAIWNRRMEMIAPLLELGADPNMGNHKGHTALHHLFSQIQGAQDRALLGQLLDHQANGLAQDRQGNTPYHMLAMGTFRSAAAASTLAEMMCDRVGLEGWSRINLEGHTPIQCARLASLHLAGKEHWMLSFAAAIEHSVLERSTAQVATPTAATKPRGRL